MTTTSTSDFRSPERHDRLLREWEHDPYKSRQKPEEPAVCPQCEAVFHHGRWQWDGLPKGAHKVLCPACHRIQDKVPAGFLSLGGPFLATHRDEIVNLIRHVEQRENNEHPMKRIMDMEDEADGMLITFTDPHLARDAGEALQHAYQGELHFAYQAEEYLLRVTWKR